MDCISTLYHAAKFSFSHNVFKNLLFNPLLHRYSFQCINTRQFFENIVGKEEIARNEQFLLFPQCFLLNQKLVSPFVNIYDIIWLFAVELEEPKNGISGTRFFNA